MIWKYKKRYHTLVIMIPLFAFFSLSSFNIAWYLGVLKRSFASSSILAFSSFQRLINPSTLACLSLGVNIFFLMFP